jgi:6-phosphogluconolactonase
VPTRKSEAGAELVVSPDLETLSREAARRFLTLAQACDPFSVALAGGSTPRRLYETLAAAPFREQVPWERVHVFWGDERAVPPEHPGSNYRMARETLLAHVPLPPHNVHRVRGELEPGDAARAYADELRAFFGARWPAFDLVLLGMGDDGHTASLFPGSAMLTTGGSAMLTTGGSAMLTTGGSEALRETTQPVLGVTAHYQDRPARRVTLTPPAINAARNVFFLVSGAGKAQTLRAVLEGPYQPDLLPAQIVRPVDGHVLWLVDAAAAADLCTG